MIARLAFTLLCLVVAVAAEDKKGGYDFYSEDMGCIIAGVESVEFLAEFNIPSGEMFEGTVVGGLSAITYDDDRDVYYLLSDDRSDREHRFYTAKIDLNLYSVDITDVTFLKRSNGGPFVGNDLDPEGFVYSGDDTIFMSSEREPAIVMEFDMSGYLLRYLNVPDYYMTNSDGSYGTRNNLGFEGLSLTPDEVTLWAANEGALAQDGPSASLEEPSPARMVKFDIATGQPGTEVVYISDLIARPPIPTDGFADNGITEIVALDNKGNKFLVLERSFSVGAELPDRGYTVKLYEVDTEGASDVSGYDTLPASFTPVSKKLLANIEADYGVIPDNLEGLQLINSGCDEAVLIVMSDDNFSAFGPQSSQFIFLKLQYA